MKKKIMSGFICCLFMLPAMALPQQSRSNTPMGKFFISFNPLGFVQFGPTINAEFAIGQDIFIGPVFRSVGLGLLSHVIAEDEIGFGTMSFGIAGHYFLNNRRGPNRFYVGSNIEYGFGPTMGDKGSYWEWEGKWSTLIFATNTGYRIRMSNFYINLGLYAGIAQEIRDDWWYIRTPSNVREADLNTHFYGMLEISIGWEIK